MILFLALHRRTPPEHFRLHDDKARAFLYRSLRRSGGSLAEGEGPGAAPGENWLLPALWNPMTLSGDQAGDVENLILSARDAGVITCDLPGTDVELLIGPAGSDGWMYQWRVSFPAGSSFSVASPCLVKFRRIGHYDEDLRGKLTGTRAALAILREAVDSANQLLGGYTAAEGRIPGRD